MWRSLKFINYKNGLEPVDIVKMVVYNWRVHKNGVDRGQYCHKTLALKGSWLLQKWPRFTISNNAAWKKFSVGKYNYLDVKTHTVIMGLICWHCWLVSLTLFLKNGSNAEKTWASVCNSNHERLHQRCYVIYVINTIKCIVTKKYVDHFVVT